ncbi:MAG: S-adenosylmethionine:tRNA ribosyltransferase-isomerase [Chloroflexi bacterium]|nr:MAG: S-adenosylmethionine:tRNA ribosyltransferase-isomerase [Chloroflexota bacterium]
MINIAQKQQITLSTSRSEKHILKITPPIHSDFDFTLPPELEAHEPPEARGLRRDQVRLMVSSGAGERVEHTQFTQLPNFLAAGDVLVINTSATRPASLPAARRDGTPLRVHLSTQLPADLWLVELRRSAESASRPFLHAAPGETLTLPDGASITLHTPHAAALRHQPDAPVRLWVASLHLPQGWAVDDFLARHGAPIRYSYVPRAWPISSYQTVYATEPGSAEMPSAGRAFTPELLTRLAAQGVQIAPLVLHTGVASQEHGEPPYEEFYRVPPDTARRVNAARAAGRRVIAVGTTVVRALETVADADGLAHPGEGWTTLVITPSRKMRVVSGLLTGLHEPEATHLAMLRALASRAHLQNAYTEALRQRYLWHEFGDLHLILP